MGRLPRTVPPPLMSSGRALPPVGHVLGVGAFSDTVSVTGSVSPMPNSSTSTYIRTGAPPGGTTTLRSQMRLVVTALGSRSSLQRNSHAGSEQLVAVAITVSTAPLVSMRTSEVVITSK